MLLSMILVYKIINSQPILVKLYLIKKTKELRGIKSMCVGQCHPWGICCHLVTANLKDRLWVHSPTVSRFPNFSPLPVSKDLFT